jgi:RHS repeat-associated protein
MHWASGFSISSNTLGLSASLYDGRVRPRSTGKERDTESGNDYFGARYYASSMGRFMSPDWSAKVMPVPYAKLGDPQSLNLYSYVMNNPMIRFDRDGHACDSLWHCAQSFLNVVEVKVTAGIQTGVSGQWGVAKAKAQATLIGAEAHSGLGGGNADASVQSKASASASVGPASVSASVGGQVSATDGASLSASAKASVGPAEASATASLDPSGGHASTSLSADPSKSVSSDSKLGLGINALVGGEVSINFSQLGRALGDVGDSLNALGSYINTNVVQPMQNSQPITPTAPFDYHP